MVVRVCGAHGGGRGEPTGDAARHIASGRRRAARCAKIDLWIPPKRSRSASDGVSLGWPCVLPLQPASPTRRV